MEEINIYEVVKKLVGEINPVGETNADNKRFENLKVMTELVDELLMDINDIGFRYRNNCQFSMKRASNFAKKFLAEEMLILKDNADNMKD